MGTVIHLNNCMDLVIEYEKKIQKEKKNVRFSKDVNMSTTNKNELLPLSTRDEEKVKVSLSKDTTTNATTTTDSQPTKMN